MINSSRSHTRFVVLLAVLTLTLPASSFAQSFSLGADMVSRYIWRGVDFGESFSIQPALEFAAGDLAIGSWASYSISMDGAGANEHDLYLSYGFGPVSLGVTDYYFPGPGNLPFSNFEGCTEYGDPDDPCGAHFFELNAGFGGTETFPLTISANIFFYNDPDNSIYLELGYPFTVEDVDLGFALGIVPQESAFYGTGAFGVTVLGLSAAKEIPITDTFSLPISVSYILNPTPDAERSFLVFGLSL